MAQKVCVNNSNIGKVRATREKSIIRKKYQSQNKKVAEKQLEDSASADKGSVAEQVELHSSKQIEQTKSTRNQASSYQEQEASSCQEKTVKLNKKLHEQQCSFCSVNKTCTLNDL